MTDRPLDKKTALALGHRIAYHERGAGAPILLLHGNPTSSYIWRNVVPSLERFGRVIVPDLIGMGDSEKLREPAPGTYGFVTHRDHLAAFIAAVCDPDEKLLLVGHDWGAALAFDWANRHRERVRGIAYMEAIVRPFTPADGSSELGPTLMALRSPDGEALILEQNVFVEQLLPKLTLRTLSDAEMAEYRRPFATPQDRWPTLDWPRQIPLGGKPAEVVAIVDDYAAWMAENALPKLFVNAEPGVVLTRAPREFCRSWKNQTEVTVAGKHFIQEDSPEEIGAALARWIAANGL
ncbi:haloalkane dehalogenase [Burkholderia sp. 22PA0099]|uniref:haloalkane dehalogenase n=1 Tax=Burkholderia sp. 22PA0099 TaxID=3237372 RepID=UPI0039C00F10